jgi:polar amino acid transport system substrate-binding protein
LWYLPEQVLEKAMIRPIASSRVRIVLVYVLFSLAYFLLIDHFLLPLSGNEAMTILLADSKGIAFIVITSLILYLSLKKAAKIQHKIEEQEKEQITKMAQADKMITLGTLVSGVAHEINNPINFITLNLPLLRDFWQGARPILEQELERGGDFPVGRFQYSVLRQRIDRMFEGIEDGTKRIKDIVTVLKDFGRPDPADLTQSVDLNGVIVDSVKLLESTILRLTDRFSFELDPSIPKIIGNYQRMEQIVANLLQNALESLPSKERAVTISSKFELSRGLIVIKIKDEGCGIEAAILPKITDPFFTTKRTSGGMGLGLAVVVRFVREHGGTLEFDSQIGKGTTVTMSFKSKRSKEGSS